MIENIISDYVVNACKKMENILSESFFSEHIFLVNEYGKKLSDILNADKEIVSLSAYLHDISAVLNFKTLPVHNQDSARIAAEVLAENDYSRDKIERVSQCIIKHVSPLGLDGGT